MKLVKPSFEIIEQQLGLDGIFKQIELAGRTCYKSEDKITETSAKEFVDRIMKSGHGAMLEHGTVYLKVPDREHIGFDLFFSNPATKITERNKYLYISTNYRVLLENFNSEYIPCILQYLCESTEFHEKRVTIKFICDRGVSHEFVRHRLFSFAQESTRYCNYSKDKFGNELIFIVPCWMLINEGTYNIRRGEDYWGNDSGPILLFNENEVYFEDIPNMYHELLYFISSLKESESNYFKLLSKGWKPQQARAVLPNALKTELVMTGFVSDWWHFFSLRCDPSAHPQAQELAIPLRDEFVRRGLIKI